MQRFIDKYPPTLKDCKENARVCQQAARDLHMIGSFLVDLGQDVQLANDVFDASCDELQGYRHWQSQVNITEGRDI